MAIGSRAEYLLVTSNFPPVIGGSAEVYRNLCRAAGGKIAVLTTRRDYRSGNLLAPPASEAHEGFSVDRIDLLRPLELFDGRRSPPRILNIFRDFALTVRVLRAVAWLLRTRGIAALVIGDLVYGGWIGIAARRLFGLPFVVYLHGEELTIRGNGLAARTVPRTLRSAAGLIAVSRFTWQVLVDGYGVDPDRIALVRNGVDTTRFRPQARPPELVRRYRLEGKRVLLTVGRLIPRKGIDRMLCALPAIAARVPELHYLIVGDGPFRAELEELAADRGVWSLVTFCGQVSEDELVQHYALADLFAMPNRQTAEGDTEGFGLVFLEAGACGIPVIAGRAGGTADAVADGVNGLIVDGEDVTAIEEAVLRVLLDRGFAESLGRNGLATSAHASWDSRWRSLDDFLQRATGRTAADPLRSRGARP
jgi:phosphatidylinositol alpha-1,6-mannosyltransferase